MGGGEGGIVAALVIAAAMIVSAYLKGKAAQRRECDKCDREYKDC